jgi:hypothetical protein
MRSSELHPYYAARKPRIVADFLESLNLASATFAERLPEHSLEALTPLVLDEMERVFPTIPYVGGAEGRMTTFFEQNVGVIALGRVLRSLAIPIPTISQLLRTTFMSRLANLPDEERLALGRQWLSKENQAYLRTVSHESARRENPGDFVYEFVEPGLTEDGEPFDFGLDYHECGFCKLCKAGGDEDLLPMMCAMDDEVYGLRGIKLFRTTTLASGAKKCNFRFRAMDDPTDDA